MPTYIGYNTQQTQFNSSGTSVGVPPKAYANTTLVDEKLVVQDLINAFNIRKGSKPGQPSYGCAIWDYVFESNDSSLQANVSIEIKNIVKQDNRLILNSIIISTNDNGLSVQLELAVTPFNIPFLASILFDSNTNTAYRTN